MTLDELRLYCMGLPETHEKETWGDAENPPHPTFRVRGRIYVIATIGEPWVSIRTTLDQQADLMDAFPSIVRSASHVGRFGWVAVDTDALDPAIVRPIIESAWRRTAPRAVVAAFDAAGGVG